MCEQRDHAKNIQDQLDSERNSFNDKYKKDVASLKEQLQVREGTCFTFDFVVPFIMTSSSGIHRTVTVTN